MGDMDPCECIWSHEMAMRRLLSWLRQSQAHCTDTECIDDIIPGGSMQVPGSSFIIMSLFVAFALAMYFLRPSALRNTPNIDSKPRGGHQGGNGAPPTPPPATS